MPCAVLPRDRSRASGQVHGQAPPSGPRPGLDRDNAPYMGIWAIGKGATKSHQRASPQPSTSVPRNAPKNKTKARGPSDRQKTPLFASKAACSWPAVYCPPRCFPTPNNHGPPGGGMPNTNPRYYSRRRCREVRGGAPGLQSKIMEPPCPPRRPRPGLDKAGRLFKVQEFCPCAPEYVESKPARGAGK